jgi:hypothetical protein
MKPTVQLGSLIWWDTTGQYMFLPADLILLGVKDLGAIARHLKSINEKGKE